MAHIGIDIGTSYSSVCILNENGQPERVKIATGTSVYGDSYSLPTAVFLEEDGKLLLGQAAMANRMRAPQNFKAEFKRDLGQLAPYLLGTRQYLPEDLYKEFFIYIKKCVEEYTRGSVTDATVTFPASFNENKKKLIETAAKRAGLLNVTMLDEPSAAAYCYLNAGKLSEDDTLLVYDLGGGTFDLALMRMKGGKFEQLTQPMGNPRLGGADIDKLIFNDIMAQIGEEKIEPLKTNTTNYNRFITMVLEMAIKAKHHLSSAGLFSDVISVGYDAVEYTLDRGRFNMIIASVIDDTMNQVRSILQTANLKSSDVKKVLLVGGASRIPLVGEMLSHGLGQAPLKDVDPELAVCEGAVVITTFQKKHEEQQRREQEWLKRKEAEAQQRALEEQRRREQEEQMRKLEEQKRRVEEANRRLEAREREIQKQRQVQQQPEKRGNTTGNVINGAVADNRAEKILLSCDAKVVTQALKFALKGRLVIKPGKLTFYVSEDHWAYSGAKEFTLLTNEIIRVDRQPFRAETAGGAAAMLIPQVAIVKGIAKIPKNKKGVKVLGKHGDYLFGLENEACATSLEMALRQYIK